MPSLDVHCLDGGDDAEVARLGEILDQAFTTEPGDGVRWLHAAGLENARVAGRGRGVAGGLVQIPMGQWFGGRSVPMVGIAGVAVPPESRGRGIASALMTSTVRELASRGVALSTLFPATLSLYRAAGYEQAGGRFRITVEPGRVGVADREIAARRAEERDLDGIAKTYTEVARATSGYVDREERMWDRVRRPWRKPTTGYVVADRGRVEGYLYVSQSRAGRARHTLDVKDVAARTPRAARRLLSLLADDRTLGERACWYGGPADALAGLLPERAYRMDLVDHWMLRIVDVPVALRARGYPSGLSARLDLDVTDPIVEDNAGRFTVEIASGRASVARGGRGAVRVHVRGLASLYSGFRNARALRLAGLLDGDDASLDAASAAFAGPAPCMVDDF